MFKVSYVQSKVIKYFIDNDLDRILNVIGLVLTNPDCDLICIEKEEKDEKISQDS